MVAIFTANAEYIPMALTTCEATFVSSSSKRSWFAYSSVELVCDYQETISITANPISRERTKHIAVDCHFFRDNFKDGLRTPSYISTKMQLADFFTKVKLFIQHSKLLSKLGFHTWMNSPLEGKC